MRINSVYGIALLLLASGCANMHGLDPQEKTADTANYASSKTYGKVKVSDAAWPNNTWWQQYGDAQLARLIDEALKGSPDLAVARARVRLAAAQSQSADAARGLSVTAEAALPGAELPKTLLGGELSNYTTMKLLNLGAKYDFDLWGGARSSWEAALGNQRAAEVDNEAAKLTLITQIAQTYNVLGYAYTSNDIAREDLARANTLLALTKQRVAAGVDSVMQLRQAELAVASGEQSVTQTQQEINTARFRLVTLIGLGPDRAEDIQRPEAMHVADISLPADLPANLLGRRPDIVAARWRVEASGRSIEVSKARFFPNVSLSANVGMLSQDTSGLFNIANRFVLFTPAVSLPLFDSGRLRANLATSDAQYDLSVTQYNKTLVSAFNEVADEMNQLQALEKQAEAQQRAVAAAKEAWELASQRYQNGIGSYVEVLTVQQSLHTAQNRQAEIESQRVTASLNLVRSLGGGFQDPDAPQAAPTATASAPAPHN